ncbi:MAG TPA: hypothetical protein VGJ57_03950 [Nitrospirales bacterium]|jgi:hypothetical protein
MRPRHGLQASSLLLLSGIVACSAVQHSEAPVERPAAPALTSFFVPDPQDVPLYEALEKQADQLLATCAQGRTCDQAHFIRGLVALYENRETATDHFQVAVTMAPTSARAESSLFWLQILEETPSDINENGRFSHATIQLLRDLLDRELLAQQLSKELDASPVQALQRDLKARDKKLEDLTKQLKALKQIDRKMREKTLPNRPSSKTAPSGKEDR